MSRLFIAEKPELARAIVDGLGGGDRKNGYYQCGTDRVTWCIGHMLVLCEPKDFDPRYEKWNLEDLPIEIPIQYKPNPKTSDQLKIVIELMADASSIVHAGDNDAEGQLIIDELLEYAENNKPVKRFLTNDNNTEIVKKALANMNCNEDYFALYQSALARSVGDQVYGFNMTRAYTAAASKQGFDGMLGVGRVQTPILGLVVNRDRANSGHKKQSYFDVKATFNVDDQSFSGKLIVPENAPTDDKGNIDNKSFAESVCEAVNENRKCEVVAADVSEKEAAAPLPYNMLKLQADASKLFGYKPDEVMKITQELRESHRLITYNGSDCQYLNEEQHGDAPSVLAAISKCSAALSAIADGANSEIKSRAFNNKNVSAHHAIIPTSASKDISELPEKIQNVYSIIAKNYIAQFYEKKISKVTDLEIKSAGYSFYSKSSITTREGWTVLFSKEPSEDEELTNNDLSSISKGMTGDASCATEDKETKPPALYTMSSLLTDLTRVSKYIKDPDIKKLLVDKDKDKKGEHGGIGTSRTRDQIIKKLFTAGYITEKGKKVISTELGQQFFDALPEIATSPDMTALWHEQQQRIEDGNSSCTEFLEGLRTFIGEQVGSVKNGSVILKIKTHECPKCKSGLKKKKARNKKDVFWGCSSYPDCDFSVPDKTGKPDFKSLERVPCKKCNGDLKRIKGKHGFFWPCRNCSINFNDKRGKPDFSILDNHTDHECPSCQKALIRRPSKKDKNKFWYGCSGFPECKNTFLEVNGKPSTDKPVASEHSCKECDSQLIRRPSKQREGQFWYACSAFPDCKKTYQEKDGRPNYG